MIPRFPRTMISLLLAGLTTACSSGDVDRDLVVSIIDEDGKPVRALGTRMDFADATLRQSVAQGLVTLNDEGQVVPGIAARWIVTEDALSYIFRLRDMQWADGTEVTAERIAQLLRERMRELQDSRLGGQVNEIESIRSMVGQVVEIQLNRPRPDFLQFLAQPEFGLFRGKVGVGPMLVDSSRPLTLRPAQTAVERWDLAPEDAEESFILIKPEPAAQAIARFRLGFSDVVLNGQFQHLPLADAADLDGTVMRFDPVAGLFGLRFRRAEGLWANVDNRRAVSMALDRPAMLASFPVTAWQERLKIVPEALNVEDVDALPDWTGQSIEQRRAEARTIISATAGDADKLLRVWLPDGQGSRILLQRLRSDLATIGVRVEQVTRRDAAQAELIDWIAPYDGQRWFLSAFTCNATPVCSLEADLLLTEADNARSVTTQRRLYAQAEQLMVRHYNYIPLSVPVRWSLVRSPRSGFAVNARGWHPLHAMIGLPIS